MSTSTVYISRLNNWFGRFRRLRVLLDGEVVGTLRNRETLAISVSPGLHTLQTQMNWCTSQPLEIQLEAGSTRRFQATLPRLGDVRWAVWIAPEEALGLVEVEAVAHAAS